jgi:hypothetical protein
MAMKFLLQSFGKRNKINNINSTLERLKKFTKKINHEMNCQIKNEDEKIKFINNNFEFFNKSIIYFF